MLEQKGIRKAAVFLNGLDWETANMLLKRLPPEESRAVRREMVAVQGISSGEVNKTVKQFLQETKYEPGREKSLSANTNKSPKTVFSEDGVDLFELSTNTSNTPGYVNAVPEHVAGTAHPMHEIAIDNTVNRAAEKTAEIAGETQSPATEEKTDESKTPVEETEPRRFDYLERMSAFDTASFLAEESEQLIAVVLSQMTPRYSGDVLACFEQSLKRELIRRLAKLDAPDEVILDEIDAVLRERLKREVEELPKSKPGLALLEQILQVVDNELDEFEGGIGHDIISGLNEIEYEEQQAACCDGMYEEMMPDNEGVLNWGFEELALLEDHELGMLFRSQNREIVVQSLLASDDSFVSRVLGQYPVYEQVSLRKMMREADANGIIDTDEPWYARQCVVQGAMQLIEEGLIGDIPLRTEPGFVDTRSILVDYSV